MISFNTLDVLCGAKHWGEYNLSYNIGIHVYMGALNLRIVEFSTSNYDVLEFIPIPIFFFGEKIVV